MSLTAEKVSQSDAPAVPEDAALEGDAAAVKETERLEEEEGCSFGQGLLRLFEACPDDRLMPALPALLKVLPGDAQDRCLIVLREAIADELSGGVLHGDDDGQAMFRSLLHTKADAAAHAAKQPMAALPAAKPSKPAVPAADQQSITPRRPFRAMAVPFATISSAAATKAPQPGAAASMPAVAAETACQNDRVPLTAKGASEAAAPDAPKHLPESAADLGRASAASGDSAMSVYVANVPFDADEAAIRGFFNYKCAPSLVESVRIIQRLDGELKGAAVVSFDTHEGAQRALLLDGEPGLEERKLIVKPDLRASGEGKGKGKGRLKRGNPGAREETDGEPARKTPRQLGPAAAEAAERSVIVKNLAFNATDAHLGVLFASIGEISEVRVARDVRSGRAKGFAVVEFTDKVAVPEALKRSGRLVRGRSVKVEAMHQKGSNAPPKEASAGVRVEAEEGSKHGANMVDTPAADARTPAVHPSEECALGSVAGRDEEVGLPSSGEEIEGEPARKTPRHLGPAAAEAAARSVIVKNLSFNATDAHVRVLFASIGEISEVRVPRDVCSGRPKGFAVVEFTDKVAVPTALKRSGRLVCGRPVKVEAMHQKGSNAPPKEASAGMRVEAEEGPKHGANMVDTPAADARTLAVHPPEECALGSVAGRDEEVALPSSGGPIGRSPALVAEQTGTEEREEASELLRRHAEQLKKTATLAVLQVAETTDPQSRSLPIGDIPAATVVPPVAFPEGEAGLKASVALISEHSSPEALLAALGAEGVKQRLAAMGLKSGGSPLERAHRLLQLRDAKSLAELPQDLFPRKAKNDAKKDIRLRLEPIKFVRAGEGDADSEPMVAD